MSTQRLLVFPSSIDAARPFMRVARSLGFEIIGADSIQGGVAAAEEDRHIHLPFITDPRFDAAFFDSLAELGITHVHAPHHGVWWHLNKLREQPGKAFFLCAPHPFDSHWEAFSPSLKWAESQATEALARALPTPPRGLAAVEGVELEAQQEGDRPGEPGEARICGKHKQPAVAAGERARRLHGGPEGRARAQQE